MEDVRQLRFPSADVGMNVRMDLLSHGEVASGSHAWDVHVHTYARFSRSTCHSTANAGKGMRNPDKENRELSATEDISKACGG